MSIRLLMKIFVGFIIIIAPVLSEVQQVALIRDTNTIGAALKSQSYYYLLRPKIVEITISNQDAIETSITMPSNNGLRPNVITVKSGSSLFLFMRSNQALMHKNISTNTLITSTNLSFSKDNYQLVHIGNDRLLHTEVYSNTITLYLTNYKGGVVTSYPITNSSPYSHYVLKLRGGKILCFTQGSSSTIDTTVFDDSLTYLVTRPSSSRVTMRFMKVYELEDNVFTLCNIVSGSLQCIGGSFTQTLNTIIWKSAITVQSKCADVFWYHILPIETTGQALSLCLDSASLVLQKFNSNTKKGNSITKGYQSVERVFEILSLSNSLFIIIFNGNYQLFSLEKICYEQISFPTCADYTLSVASNDNVPMYKAGYFASDTVKVTITILPTQGSVVDYASKPVTLDSAYTLNTVNYKRGSQSGTFSFRYEIVSNDGTTYTSPCLVTVEIKCYSACKTCQKMGDANQHYCLTCSSGGLMPYTDPIMLGNCKGACDDGYYVDNEFFCHQCEAQCLTCKGAPKPGLANCLTCPIDKYSLKVNDSYNCLDACPQFYFADASRVCVKCYSSCAECNEVGTTEAHNCSLCPTGHFLLALDSLRTKFNCYADKCPDSYYVIVKECTKCYETCVTCKSTGFPNNHNCQSCKEPLLFLPTDTTAKVGNCVDSCPFNSFVEDNQCVYCHEDCSTCSEKGNDVNSKCLTCLNNKKVLLSKETADSGSCVVDCPLDSYPFAGKCCKCFPFCDSCTSNGSFLEHNCLTCIDGLLQDPLTIPSLNNCVYTCRDGFYTDDDIKCKKCFNTCYQCNKGPSLTKNNCLRCIDKHIFHPTIPTNCVPDCKGDELNWIFNTNGVYECTSSAACPSSHPILEPKLAQCVKSCTTDPECVRCKKEVFYEHKSQCLQACPQFYKTNANNICERIPIEGLSPPSSAIGDQIIYNTSSSKEDFIGDLGNMVEKSLDDILKSGKKDPVIVAKNEDYEYIFSKAGSDISGESNGSTIDLGECEPKLRQAYSIPLTEDLYIGQVIFPQAGKSKDVMQYAVYDSQGRQLSLDACKDVPVKINQPLKIDASLLIEAERMMTVFKIDVFDPNGTFYSDVCFNYTDSNNTDYTLDGRRDKFIDEESFCTKDCTYTGVNFTTDSVICNCQPSPNKKISPIIDDSQFIGNILSTLPLSNMEMFICFSQFTKLYLLDNYGFMIILAFQAVEVAFFVTYFFVQMPLMFSKCPFIYLNPPIKHGTTISLKANISNQSAEESKDTSKRKNSSNSSGKVSIYNNDIKPNSNTSILQKMIKENKTHPKAQSAIQESLKNSCSDEELNEMEYKDALDKDKRHFCRYYWSIIKEKEMILATFASDDPCNPVLQRVFVSFYILSAYFFVNALFYTDAFVAAPSYFDFLFLLDNELQKCFFVSLVIKVLSKIILSMMSLGKQLRKAFKTKESEVKYQREVAHLIRGNKVKTIILFVLMVLTSLLMVYYVTIFCRLYPNNQVTWVISTIISMVFNLLLSALLCLVMGATRFISFRMQKEFIYKLSGYVAELM